MRKLRYFNRSPAFPKRGRYITWVQFSLRDLTGSVACDIFLSEQLYKSGRIRPTLSTGQFSNLSKNQCYISRWTLWHIKFGAVTKTEALGVISSFRGWISLYRASRQNILFFSRYAEKKNFLVWSTMSLSSANSEEKRFLKKLKFSCRNWTKSGVSRLNMKLLCPRPKLTETQNQVKS